MLGLTTWDLIILMGYFVIVATIGVISTRLIRNREDYLMGGRRFGKVMTIFFSFGAGTHSDTAVGVAAQSYKVGFAGFWYQGVQIFTLPIYWLLAPIFRRARVLTTADFFERRFGTFFTLLYSAFALFLMVAFTSVGLYGTARLVEALVDQKISWQLVIPMIAIVSLFYGIAGGLIAAVWNDLFQGILTIVMSILIIPFFWSRIGGLHGFQMALPDAQKAFRLVLQEDMTIYWIIMMSINSLLSMVVQPHIMANAGSAKSEMDSRVGFVGGMILKRLMTIPWALTGVMAIALFGAGKIEGDHAFGAMARELLPSGFAGLMIACVFASIMDNVAVFMISFAGIYTNNIHKTIFPVHVVEKNMVRLNRLAALAFGVIVIPLSYSFNDVPEAMRFIFVTVPLMGIAFFMAIWWRRANRWGAFASFASALTTMLFSKHYLGWAGDAGLPKTIALYLSVGILVGIIVSWLTPPEPKIKLDRFYLLLNTPIGQEEVLRQAGLIEIPGTGTFEEPQSISQDQEIVMPYRKIFDNLEIPLPGRDAKVGFIWVSLIMLVLIGGVVSLANWFANG
jgi:Na+/proline symporter